MKVIANRKIDELGRLVLPLEIRATLNLENGDSMTICLEGNKIILLSDQNHCALCKTTENLKEIDSYYICENCKEKISDLV